MTLTNGSAAFSEWSAPTAPVLYRFYLFSVDNAEDVLERGEKPRLVEKGPYVFQ